MKKETLIPYILLIVIIVFYEFGVFGNILHVTKSFYQNFGKNQYIKVMYSKMLIPSNSYLVKDSNSTALLEGPSLGFSDDLIYVKVYKTDTALTEHAYYADLGFCINVDSEEQRVTNVIYQSDIIRNISFENNIIFCEESRENKGSFVSYYNKALMVLIVIQPYKKEYKKDYVKYLDDLKFETSNTMLPSWIKPKEKESSAK